MTIHDPQPGKSVSSALTVESMRESDLSAADHLMRLAFGTYLGLPEPTSFMADADYVRTRWRANPSAAFVAKQGGEVVGSNFATCWGSVGFFGPLSVHPRVWDRGLGKQLMEPVLACFERWGCTHRCLFTFAQSAKHVGLYRTFGFWPRFLTAIMSKPVGPQSYEPQWTCFSKLTSSEQEEALCASRSLTNSLYEGLDVSSEIRAIFAQGLGEVILLGTKQSLKGLAVCHHGAGTEAGSNNMYIKFAATAHTNDSAKCFHELLIVCESYAAKQGLARITAGVNTAHYEAYKFLLETGYRTDLQGIAMHFKNDPGYSRPGVFVLNDWR